MEWTRQSQFFKLISYLIGHKLYKPQQRKCNFKRAGKYSDKQKEGIAAHTVAGTNNEPSSIAHAGVGSNFTPA